MRRRIVPRAVFLLIAGIAAKRFLLLLLSTLTRCAGGSAGEAKGARSAEGNRYLWMALGSFCQSIRNVGTTLNPDLHGTHLDVSWNPEQVGH